MTPLLFMYFRAPTRWTDIVKRTIHEIGDDNCLGLAAQLAFYFLLALFPAVLFLVALVGYMPVENALSELLVALGAIGGAIVTMLWFYVSGLAILIGAELNGVIEAAWRSSRSEASISP